MENSLFINDDGSLKQCKICVPLVSKELATLKEEITAAMREKADILEWRVDKFSPINSKEELVLILGKIAPLLKSTPLLFTWRSHRDGGEEITDSHYKNLISWAIASGKVAAIDLELSCVKTELAKLNQYAISKNVETIISHHNFEYTPSLLELKAIINQLMGINGSVIKLAVMPKNTKDVINLMQAVADFKEEYPQLPIAGISMGKLGGVTRLWADRLGMAFTFGTVGEKSAPGQLSVKDIRHFVKIM